MRKSVIAVLALAVAAGCAHTQQRSKYDVWTVPQTSPSNARGAQAAATSKSIAIAAPAIIGSGRTPDQIQVTLCGDLAGKTREVRLSTFPAVLPSQPRWKLAAAPNEIIQRDGVAVSIVQFALNAKAGWPTGYATLRAEAFDDKGQSLGAMQQQVINVGDAVRRFISDIGNAHVADLAKTDPYRAAAWMGAASAVGRFSQAVDAGDAANVGRLLLEADTRIRILQGQRPVVSREYLHDLLILGADPEAQVAITYPAAAQANIAYYWAAIPLGSVGVRQFDSADAAVRELGHSFPGVFFERTPLFHQPNAMRSSTLLECEPATVAEIDLYRDVIVWFPRSNALRAVAPEQLGLIRYDAIVKLPGMHSNPATAVAFEQQDRPVPVVSLKDAGDFDAVVILGDPRAERALAGAKYERMIPRRGVVTLAVAEGDRLYTATAPSEACAFSMIHYAIGKGPVSVSQVNTLRNRVLKACDGRDKADGCDCAYADLKKGNALKTAYAQHLRETLKSAQPAERLKAAAGK